jgi:hypothetical protein
MHAEARSNHVRSPLIDAAAAHDGAAQRGAAQRGPAQRGPALARSGRSEPPGPSRDQGGGDRLPKAGRCRLWTAQGEAAGAAAWTATDIAAARNLFE